MSGSLPLIQQVTQLLGAEPTAWAPTSSPYAVLLDVAGQQLVVKTSPPMHPAAVLVEAWAYQACRRQGVRTPTVIAVAHDPACLIVDALPGSSLWVHGWPADAARAIWLQVGADLRAMHEIRLAGFGPLAMTDSGAPHGEAAQWCPWLAYARDYGLAYLVDAQYLSVATARQLERRLEAAAPLLAGGTVGRLLHGDLEGGHVFSTPAGGYSGLIDFGLAQAGDPRWDLARVGLWDGPTAQKAVLDGYGREAVTAEDWEVVLPAYVLAFVIHQSVMLDKGGRREAVVEHLQQVM